MIFLKKEYLKNLCIIFRPTEYRQYLYLAQLTHESCWLQSYVFLNFLYVIYLLTIYSNLTRSSILKKKKLSKVKLRRVVVLYISVHV